MASTSFACAAWAVMTATTGRADVPAGFVDASAFGYDAADATAALQAAIDTGVNVYVPNLGTDWVVSPITLSRSNQEILFESGVVVSAKSGAFQATDATLFSATGQSNIKVTGYGATLRMNKGDYQQAPYSPGEHRHGLNLIDVNGFEVYGLTIEDTGGDGIYVGTGSETGFSRNVTIKDVRLDNNHRQGLSVISVENLTVDNAVILNTGGAAPEAGIDFEVNFQTQRLRNIEVRNTVIQANNAYGILFAGHGELTTGPITADIGNVTILGNDADGIRMYVPLPGVTISDSLIVGSGGYGFRGTPVTTELTAGEIFGTGPTRNAIDHSALWQNDLGAKTGWTRLGPGTLTNIEPIFYSLDPDSEHFLYLDETTALAIKEGAQDGGYIGARPVFVPEPASAAVTLGGAALLLQLRRRSPANHGLRLPTATHEGMSE